MNLDEQLEALKHAENRVAVPAHVEARLLRALEELPGQPADRRVNRAGVFVAVALAAGIVVGVTSTVVYFQRGPAPPTLAAETVGESVVLVLEPPGVEETVRVVRIRVARSALESLGIHTVASQGTDSVEVDVLVGEDGVARGVRLAM